MRERSGNAEIPVAASEASRPDFGEKAALLVATLFGLGRAPIAPGTVATIAAIPLQIALAFLPSPRWSGWAQGIAILLTALAGVAAASVAERRAGHNDPSEVVIDEVAGYLVTMFLIPPGVLTVVSGFLAFRVLDIVKPWPADLAERLPRGWGIMADDIICGIYANVLLRGVWWLLR